MSLVKDTRFALGIATGKPFQVLVQVTNRCNMRCSFCDFWPNGVPPAEELTVADYQKLAAELADAGTFLVSVEGGEPTLRPDLVEIVRAFGVRHLPVLYTNGWHVTPELARSLFDAGLTQVGVSIDFSDPIRHDAKRGLAGAYERAWRAVDTFKKAAPLQERLPARRRRRRLAGARRGRRAARAAVALSALPRVLEVPGRDRPLPREKRRPPDVLGG